MYFSFETIYLVNEYAPKAYFCYSGHDTKLINCLKQGPPQTIDYFIVVNVARIGKKINTNLYSMRYQPTLHIRVLEKQRADRVCRRHMVVTVTPKKEQLEEKEEGKSAT